MRARFCTLLLLVLLCSTPACVYADVQVPLDVDLHQTQLGDKVGEASTHSVLWAVAWGDSGTRAAAESAGIRRILHADRKVFSILWGLYTRTTTVVYGE